MKMKIEEETQKHETERKKREEEFNDREERYKRHIKEKEEERERMKMKIEEETQKHETERKKREEEFNDREERYKREIKEKEEQERQMRDEMKRQQDTFKSEIEKLKLQNEEYDTEIKRIMRDLENEQDNVEERKRREREYSEREEQYKTEIKEMRREREDRERQTREENEKMREREREMWDEYNQRLKQEREDMQRENEKIKQQKERIERETEELQLRHTGEIERIRKHTEEDKQNQDREKEKREEEYKTEMKDVREMRDEMRRERDTFKSEIEELKKENKDLQINYDKLMNTIENQERERKKREDEIKERVEQYKREIKEKEENEKMVFEDMRREREEREKQEEKEKLRREEDEKEKLIHVKQCEKLKREMEEIMREKERIEREKQHQLEEFEKRVQEEKNMREEQQKNFEDELKLLKEESEDELKRRERKKEEITNICPQSQTAIQTIVYRRLETENSKWSWTLRSAMLEIENKLHKIENEAVHEIEERDLQRELKEKSDEVKQSMSEFFEKDTDKDILIQWKTSFEIKIKELQENIIRETRRKVNEVLQQRDLKRKIDTQRRTHHENTLLEKSKELALKHKDKTNDEETLKREFDVFWEECVKKINTDSPPIKDINIMRDVSLLSDIYESVHVDTWNDIRDIFTVQNYEGYVQFKKSSGVTGHVKNVFRAAQEKLGYTMLKEDETQIKTLITDVAKQTDKIIQSFNIAKMGYNNSCIQQLTEYIKARITDYEEKTVKYVFKKEFFIDLVFSIFKRANNTFTDQHRMFREANDPDLYLEKKRREYYSIFQKYCQGATSAAIFGEIICQKLKEPIEQCVYKQTATDLADEMKSNCESLNGNRSNLEKHILKRLAEEENFDKYINYIHDPRDHFKSFIRDEVNQYIRDEFSVSVQLKMNQNIELLKKKIMTAAHESTQHVEENTGNVDLWLKFFTQKLSDVLIFSVKDFTGVKHDDVDDFKLLEDVISKELPPVMSDISREFSTDTFDKKLDVNNRSDEILIDHFCQCCWVQCPFCKAICTNTIENHDGDHSVPFHRVNGIIGFYNGETQKLHTDFCSGQWISFNEYRKSGEIYAKWSITSDLTELPYWKWVVCRFKKDLERYYEKMFQDDGKIPDEWRKITKQKAIESLDKYI